MTAPEERLRSLHQSYAGGKYCGKCLEPWPCSVVKLLAVVSAARAASEEVSDLSACPYFQGVGQCASGCNSEPSCQTDRPHEGWPMERVRAALAAWDAQGTENRAEVGP